VSKIGAAGQNSVTDWARWYGLSQGAVKRAVGYDDDEAWYNVVYCTLCAEISLACRRTLLSASC